MKYVFEALCNFFFWGNAYPLTDENSLPVYAGSILVSIALAWSLYPESIAIFAIILVACLLNTAFWARLSADAEDVKTTKAYFIAHNMFIVIAIIAACIVRLDFAIDIAFFIAINQLIIWGGDRLSTAAAIRRDVKRKRDFIQKIMALVSGFIEAISTMLPALIAVFFVYLCLNLPITTEAKVGCILAYFTIIPIFSQLQDDVDVTMKDIAVLNVYDPYVFCDCEMRKVMLVPKNTDDVDEDEDKPDSDNPVIVKSRYYDEDDNSDDF